MSSDVKMRRLLTVVVRLTTLTLVLVLASSLVAGARPSASNTNLLANHVRSAEHARAADDAAPAALTYSYDGTETLTSTHAVVVGAASAMPQPDRSRSEVLNGRVSPPHASVVAAEDGSSSLGLSTNESWGNPNTLEDHFLRHGADFGATSAEDYASQASEFFQPSQAEGLPTKIDADGVIRVYDPTTNTFGAYNPDGTTRTFFKPSSGAS